MPLNRINHTSKSFDHLGQNWELDRGPGATCFYRNHQRILSKFSLSRKFPNTFGKIKQFFGESLPNKFCKILRASEFFNLLGGDPSSFLEPPNVFYKILFIENFSNTFGRNINLGGAFGSPLRFFDPPMFIETYLYLEKVF